MRKRGGYECNSKGWERRESWCFWWSTWHSTHTGYNLFYVLLFDILKFLFNFHYLFHLGFIVFVIWVLNTNSYDNIERFNAAVIFLTVFYLKSMLIQVMHHTRVCWCTHATWRPVIGPHLLEAVGGPLLWRAANGVTPAGRPKTDPNNSGEIESLFITGTSMFEYVICLQRDEDPDG